MPRLRMIKGVPSLRLRPYLSSPPEPLKPSFRVFKTVPLLHNDRYEALVQRQVVGFVPTMGALHEGHLALIRQAARETDQVYVSIYVNPTQFGVNEDLNSYPQTWPSDYQKLATMEQELFRENTRGRIHAIFMPNTTTMYPGLPPSSEIEGDGSFVTITPLAKKLEGASRPVFFRGVATVVMKLLNIVQPEKVYFGQKDVQQTFVVKRMVRDFHINTKVIVAPTVREDDGLAMSSRNVYLGARRRRVALVLLNALKEVQEVFARGARKRVYLHKAAMEVLTKVQKQQQALPASQRARFEIDYISIADTETLDELEEVASEHGAIVSGAIKMLPIEEPRPGEELGVGGDASAVRLIDNIRLDLLSAKLDFLT